MDTKELRRLLETRGEGWVHHLAEAAPELLDALDTAHAREAVLMAACNAPEACFDHPSNCMESCPHCKAGKEAEELRAETAADPSPAALTLLDVVRAADELADGCDDLIQNHMTETHAWPQRVRSLRDRARAALERYRAAGGGK